MEKDKRDREELYYSSDELLVIERYNSAKLCYKYNNLISGNNKKGRKIITKLLGYVGDNFEITPPIHFDYGYNIKIGDNFYSNYNLTILDCGKVEFGNNVFIGPGCSFYTANHPIDYMQRNKGLECAKGIKVGDNVWFGGNVTVLPGVHIGSNVIIGAGSVVVKDLDSDSVAVGNPCKVIKKLK